MGLGIDIPQIPIVPGAITDPTELLYGPHISAGSDDHSTPAVQAVNKEDDPSGPGVAIAAHGAVKVNGSIDVTGAATVDGPLSVSVTDPNGTKRWIAVDSIDGVPDAVAAIRNRLDNLNGPGDSLEHMKLTVEWLAQTLNEVIAFLHSQYPSANTGGPSTSGIPSSPRP